MFKVIHCEKYNWNMQKVYNYFSGSQAGLKPLLTDYLYYHQYLSELIWSMEMMITHQRMHLKFYFQGRIKFSYKTHVGYYILILFNAIVWYFGETRKNVRLDIKGHAFWASLCSMTRTKGGITIHFMCILQNWGLLGHL